MSSFPNSFTDFYRDYQDLLTSNRRKLKICGMQDSSEPTLCEVRAMFDLFFDTLGLNEQLPPDEIVAFRKFVHDQINIIFQNQDSACQFSKKHCNHLLPQWRSPDSYLNNNVFQGAIIHPIQDQLKVLPATTRDPLTGLFNQKAMESFLAQAVESGDSKQFSVIFLDIDNFKTKVNDKYGHQKGDEVLRVLSKKLTEFSRGGDRISRYGGEEFLLYLEGISYEDACNIADRLRIAISTIKDCDVTVTVSVGVASFEKGDDVKMLIKRADDALYASKNNGKNRVTGAQNGKHGDVTFDQVPSLFQEIEEGAIF